MLNLAGSNTTSKQYDIYLLGRKLTDAFGYSASKSGQLTNVLKLKSELTKFQISVTPNFRATKSKIKYLAQVQSDFKS